MTEKREKRSFFAQLRQVDAAIPLEYGIRATMGFLLARARIFGDFAPFGVAFAAAAPAGTAGFLTVAAVCLGAFTGGMYWGFKYAAAALVIRVILQLFSDTDAAGKVWFPPLVTLGTQLLIGSVYAYDAGWQPIPTALFLMETALAAGCVLFYHAALAPWQAEEGGTFGRTCHTVSQLLLVGSLCMSLSSPMVFGVLSLGRCAALLTVMLVLYRGGLGMGCVTAAAMGAAMDLGSGFPPFFVMCYVLAALVSGVYARNGRLIFLLTFTAGTALAALWNWQSGAMLPALYENFAAAVVFMLLPDGTLAKLGTLLPSSGRGCGFSKAREYTRDRVELTSEAFRELYATVRSAVGEECDSVSLIFDRASEQVCRDCRSCSRCWTQEYSDTLDVLNNLTPRLIVSGALAEGDFPQRFANRCPHLKEFTAAINAETRTFLCRRQYLARLNEKRDAAYNQYNDIAAILRALSEELGSEIVVEPGLERKLQRYLRGLHVDAAIAVFRVRGGRLRVELRSSGLRTLTRDDDYLNKLSALLGTRLCTSEERMDLDRLVLLEAEPLAAAIGVASRRKSGETVSGDKGLYFRTDEGLLYVLLSDGMGTGPEAARLSSATAGTLERFLRAGVAPEIALRILSDLMLLRSDADLGTATVDLLCLDMFSGEAKVYKYGAAPTYLRRGGAVKRLHCVSLPIGLGAPGGKSVCAAVKLLPGATAVLVSDGVTGGENDKWLRQLIAGFDEKEEPRALARAILEAACEKGDSEDDRTVLAVTVTERG